MLVFNNNRLPSITLLLLLELLERSIIEQRNYSRAASEASG